jgi:hypothetical protein
MSRHDDEGGVALGMVLLLMAVMSLLCASMVMLVQIETKSSAAYKRCRQAYYIVHSAVQKSAVWFNNQYLPHLPSSDYDLTQSPVRYSGNGIVLAGKTGSTAIYPEAAVKSSFQSALGNQTLQASSIESGVFAVDATLLRYLPASVINLTTFATTKSAIERWRLDCAGYWGSLANPIASCEIAAVVENSGYPFFDRGLWGIDQLSLGNTIIIDSYDASAGAYGGSNMGQLGSIGSNGSVSLNGSIIIKGDVAYGPAGSYSGAGGAQVLGQVTRLSSPHSFAPIPSFTVGTQNISLSSKSTRTLAAGSYGNISLSGTSKLTLTGGVYYLNTLTQGSGTTIILSAPSTLFIKTTFSMSGGSVSYSVQDPSSLVIFYSGSSNVTLSAGTAAFLGLVYCPNASLSLTGNAGFNGSIIGKAVSNSNSIQVHYDESLSYEFLTSCPFRIITWSQSTF